MKQLFIIGGMGAGKSTAAQALIDQGLAHIDLDEVGHNILKWGIVRDELAEEFGEDILDENGEIVRSRLAQKAFVNHARTRALNRITMPRIEESFMDQIDELKAQGVDIVVVEFSVFKNRVSLANSADVVIAILAPMEARIERAVASGFTEEDVRRRIARQITDADRVEAADVVFSNDSTKEVLYNEVVDWWKSYCAEQDK